MCDLLENRLCVLHNEYADDYLNQRELAEITGDEEDYNDPNSWWPLLRFFWVARECLLRPCPEIWTEWREVIAWFFNSVHYQPPFDSASIEEEYTHMWWTARIVEHQRHVDRMNRRRQTPRAG